MPPPCQFINRHFGEVFLSTNLHQLLENVPPEDYHLGTLISAIYSLYLLISHQIAAHEVILPDSLLDGGVVQKG